MYMWCVWESLRRNCKLTDKTVNEFCCFLFQQEKSGSTFLIYRFLCHLVPYDEWGVGTPHIIGKGS